MQVRVKRSFVDRVFGVSASVGDIIEMPAGADWVRAGFVDPVDAEAATMKAPETAVTRKPRRRTKRGSKVTDGD